MWLLDRCIVDRWTCRQTSEKVISNRDTSRNAWNSRWGSFMINTEILWHSVAWPYTMITIYWSDFIPKRDPISKLNLLPNFEWFPQNICDGYGMPTGDTHSYGHLVPFHLWIAYALFVKTNPFPLLVVIIPDYALRTFLRTFSILHVIYTQCHYKTVLQDHH